MTPTPLVRAIQIGLAESRSAYSCWRSGKICRKSRTISGRSSGIGRENPPISIMFVVSRAPQKASKMIEDQLALAEAVERHRERADVEGVRAEPDQVGGDARQLRHDHAPVLGPLRRLDAAQLLDRQHAAEVVHRRGDVVGAVGPGDDLGVAVVLAQLLGAPVQVADDRVAVDDQLAVELEHDPQHAVGAGVLRPHVEGHQALAGLQRDIVLDGQRCPSTARLR